MNKVLFHISCPQCGCKMTVSSDFTSDETKSASPIADAIRKEGKTINSPRLFRRWIMSQMYHMLTRTGRYETCFSQILRDRGFRYMFKVIGQEIHDMAIITKHEDNEEVDRRLLWFNRITIWTIAAEFVKEIEKEIARLPVRYCNKVAYKHIPGYGDVYVDNIDEVLEPLKTYCNELMREPSVNTFAYERVWNEFSEAVLKFRENKKTFPLRIPVEFINAYKGNGAYFTLRNMIMFHNCKLRHADNNKMLEGGEALRHLDQIAKKLSRENEGWRLLGMLKGCLYDNGIKCEDKIQEWKKQHV